LLYSAFGRLAGRFISESVEMENRMHHLMRAVAVLHILIPFYAFAADGKILLELNTIETAENRCRLNFVIENRSEGALDTLKLDLVVFDHDGAFTRRLIADMAPIRPMKTMVRAFLVEVECPQISAILVNDVTACTPGNSTACLDRLQLSSRVKDVHLYK
jgi:hypothetical protein